MRGLGGQAFFLGVPDYGFVSRREALERLWNRDSLLERIVYALRTFRPDVVLYALITVPPGATLFVPA